jgi:hypothetical protein
MEAEGELTPELMERWTALKGDLATKTQNTASVIRNYELAWLTIDAEIKRLQALKKTADNGQSRLREYLKSCLISMGVKSVTCDTMQVSVANNPPKVVVESEADIPTAFKSVEVKMPTEVWLRMVKELTKKDFEKVSVEYILHKSLISDAIKDGQTIAGAHLEQGTSLRIK